MGGEERASKAGWLVLKVWLLESKDSRLAGCYITPLTAPQAKVAGLLVLRVEPRTKEVKHVTLTPKVDAR